jgi:hypothetical protein
VMSLGKYVGFNVPFDGFYELYQFPRWKRLSGNPKERIKKYMSSYYISIWSVFDKKSIQKAYDILSKVNLKNSNFIEIVVAIVCCEEGEIIFSDRIFGAREINQEKSSSWASRQKRLLRAAFDRGFFEQVNEISNHFNSLFGNSRFDYGLMVYLKMCFLKNISGRIQRLFRKRGLNKVNLSNCDFLKTLQKFLSENKIQ